MKYLVLLLSLVFTSVEGDRHLNTNGSFRKRHTLGDERDTLDMLAKERRIF